MAFDSPVCKPHLHIYPAVEGVPVQVGQPCRCGRKRWGDWQRAEVIVPIQQEGEGKVKVLEVLPEVKSQWESER